MEKTSVRKARLERNSVVGPWVDWKLPCANGKKNSNSTHTTADNPMHRPNSDASMSQSMIQSS
jgi:hypothetical protein